MLLADRDRTTERSLEQRIERFSYAYGKTYDSYLINDGNREIFQSSDGEGLLGYIRDGRYLHVIGGLLAAAPEAKTRLLQEFLELARQCKIRTVLFHNILEEDCLLFQPFGVELTKCGEEAVVDLEQTTWTGGAYEWVRRQESYCRRKGLVAAEVTHVLDDALKRELEWISSDHVKRTTTGKEFSYFAGRLLLDDPKRQRIFVARSAERVEAFIVCNPGKGGEFYAIEMYRYRQNAPRGAMPFLWLQTLRQLKQEGVAEASLCMMPFYGCNQKHPQDNAFLRYCNVFWYEYLNWLFNARGLRLFKSRFRPAGKSMFTVCYPKTSIGGLWSAFQLWELSSVLSPSARIKKLKGRVRGSV